MLASASTLLRLYLVVPMAAMAALLAGCSAGGGCDCTANEECINGTCVPTGDYCTSSSDCQIGFRCNLDTNTCVLLGGDDDIPLPDGDEISEPETVEDLPGDDPDDEAEDEDGIDDDDLATDDDEEDGAPDLEPDLTEEEPNPDAGTVGLYYYRHFEELPLFKPEVRTFTVSSHDPSGGDDDDRNTHQYREGSDYVLLDLKQPGCIMRMFFAEMAETGNLKITFDNGREPFYNMPMNSYFDGSQPPFVEPLSAHKGNGYVTYLPLCFREAVKVATTGKPGYYQITYQRFQTAAGVVTHTGRETYDDVVAMLSTNLGNMPVSYAGQSSDSRSIDLTAGETETMLNLAGEGVITALKLKFTDKETGSVPDFAVLKNLWVRAYWDGRSDPSVLAPVSHFFASGFEAAVVKSMPVGMDLNNWSYCYFPMPYWNGASLQLINNSGRELVVEYHISYTLQGMPRTAGHFYAVYREAKPATDGSAYTILSETGRGHYVGAFLAMSSAGANTRDYLYGDERIVVDNMRSPIWQGTDTDHYFNGHLRFMGDPYTHGLFGQPYRPAAKETATAFPAFRWHIGDFVPFNRTIDVTIEHGTGNTVPANYESVAYYYRSCLTGLVVTDTFRISDISSETAHAFSIVGEVDQEAHQDVCGCFETPAACSYDVSGCTGDFATYSGRAMKSSVGFDASMTFTMTIDPNNSGVRLSRILDYSVLSQNAQVFVDDQDAGYWYTPGRNQYRFFLEDAVDIPAAMTRNKSSVVVRLDYLAGTEFNAYEFKAFSYIPVTTQSPGPGGPENLRERTQVGLTVTMDWDPPTTGTAALFYHVYRSTSPGIPPGQYTFRKTVSTTWYTDDNDGLDLLPNTDYYYQVVAEDCAGVRGVPGNELAVHTRNEPVVAEAEAVLDLDSTTPANEIEIISDPNASGGQYVCLYAVTGNGRNKIGFKVNLINLGTYVLDGYFVKRPSAGVVQTLLAGSSIGEQIDLYSAYAEFTGAVEIGSKEFINTGDKYVIFRVMNKNALSTGYHVCVDKIVLK